jgi:tape measure domain-containing protein
MADAGTVIVNINGDDSGLTAALKRATNRIATFGQTINGRITDGLIDPTKKAKFQFKDVSRIVGGIMVSKVFYSGLNAIRNATDAVREFCTELEYTQLAFSQLFGSTDLAAEFVNVLKDFSAVSPFSFSDSSKAAQRLLAYGIEYKNVMYVMQGVLDAATMQGDPSKIEAISRALGQIYTKGTLKAEEVRQLAEAGIPAYDILREKLQLTDEAMQNLGKQGIPASVAINALVDGIHERFAGMTKDSAKTMKGMWSNIKDNFLMIMQGFFDPLYQKIRTATHMLDEFINKIREIADLKGLGGVFEYLVPDKQMQAEFRQFVAIIKELGQIIGYQLKTALFVCKGLLEGFVRVFNTVGPVLVNIGQILSLIIRELTQCKPLMTALAYLLTFNAAAWIAFRTAAFGAMILRPITSLIMLCAKALGILAVMITSHPLIAGIMVLTGAVTALGLAHSKAGQQIRDFFTKLTSWNGIDPGKQLLPETKKRTSDIEKFNERLDQTKDALDATGDAADKAAKKGKKAQKDLLSFDEVFRLTQDDQTGQDEIETPDWTVPDDWGGWGNLDGESMLPDFQKLIGGAFEKQLDKLKDTIKGIWDKFKEALPGILSGAGLGTLIGGLIGGPLGAAIGALAGGVVGYFWDKLADLIGINDKWHAAIAGGLLGGFLGLLAYLTGLGPIAAVLAALAGYFGGLFWEKIAEAFGLEGSKKKEAAISSAIGAGLGAIIGGLIGGPVGAVIGGALGTFAGEFWSILADKLNLTTGAKYAGLIAGGIAAVLGAALSNPVIAAMIASKAPIIAKALQALFSGATIGSGTILTLPAGGLLLNTASIAALAATWVSTFVNGIQTGDWSGLIPAVTGTIGRLLLGPIGGIAGVLAGHFYNATFNSLKEKFGLSNMDKIKDVIVAAFEGLVSGFMGWMIPIITPLGGALGNFAQITLTNGLKAGIAGIITSLISSALSNKLLEIMSDAFDLTDQDVKNGKTGQQIGGICGSVVGGIVGFFVGGPAGAAIGSAIGNGLGQPLGASIGALWETKISPALNTAFEGIKGFFANTLPTAWANFVTWVGTVPAKVGAFLTNVTNKIAYGLGYAAGSVVKFFTQTIPAAWNAFTAWIGGVFSAIGAWFAKVGQAVAQFFTQTLPQAFVTFFTQTLPNAWNSFKAWVAQIPVAVAQFFAGIYQTVVTFFTQTLPAAWNSFWTWVSGIPAKIAEFFTNLWNNFVQWGANIIQGLWQGIQQVWAGFIEWIHGLVQNFIQGFKDALGIASPSTVFAEIGYNIIMGLLNGIQVAWTALVEFVGGLITQFVEWFTTGFATIGDAISNFVTTSVENITTWITTTKENFIEWFTSVKNGFVDWVTNVGTNIATWASTAKQNIKDWATNALNDVKNFVTQSASNIASFVSQSISRIGSFVSTTASRISSWASQTASRVSSWSSQTASRISSWVSRTVSNISNWSSRAVSIAGQWATNFASRVARGCQDAMTRIGTFISDATSKLRSWADSMASTISGVLSRAASAASSALSSAGSWVSSRLSGHATGGIFDREHVARISEGNKAEAIIPLEDKTAMQPFVDAVSSGLAQYLGPVLANMQSKPAYAGVDNNMPPLYVGTLIADDRSLRELERKMQIIRLKETRRTT